jgi:hypothetical protein
LSFNLTTVTAGGKILLHVLVGRKSSRCELKAFDTDGSADKCIHEHSRERRELCRIVPVSAERGGYDEVERLNLRDDLAVYNSY